MNQEMDAMYLLSPLSHIVDCLVADLERRRYRKSYVIWTSGMCFDDLILSAHHSKVALIQNLCSHSDKS